MLILNGTLVESLTRLQSNYGLRIEDDYVLTVGPSADLRAQYPDDEIIDAHGGLIMPGNICAHTHFYGAFARGMAVAGPPPPDFPAILKQLWWSLDKALDADAIRLSAQVMLIEAIRNGTTTIFDHHASPNHIDGSLDIIAGAVRAAGLRAVLCYEVTDRDGPDKTAAGIAENQRFIAATQDDPMLRGTFGLHAGLTLSDETLRACAEAGDGFHIHVAEHEADQDDSLSKSGKRVVQRLHEFGILGPRSIVAHAVHCDADELALLHQSETWVTHQPRSNMNNAVGAAPLDAMLELGMRLCLGTDGFTHNMWEEWKAAYLLHKVANRDPRRAPGDDIAEMGMLHNALLTETYFPERRIGVLRPGAAADVIIVDYHPFTPLNAGNLPWHILFGFESSLVRTTIVNGRVLMRDHEILVIDEAEITAEARALAPSVWERYQNFATIALSG